MPITTMLMRLVHHYHFASGRQLTGIISKNCDLRRHGNEEKGPNSMTSVWRRFQCQDSSGRDSDV